MLGHKNTEHETTNIHAPLPRPARCHTSAKHVVLWIGMDFCSMDSNYYFGATTKVDKNNIIFSMAVASTLDTESLLLQHGIKRLAEEAMIIEKGLTRMSLDC